ncbi:RND family transporter [Parvularcula sp. IMCC14364]|uniref:efflux RND transporter permease subunit n=1 Tax=Parvularcula sp. IMCC14364 TaxID=3067902 RepID=UPI00274241A8|nr:MMPL family transporter [Parvularcula sp. IMCC14364]
MDNQNKALDQFAIRLAHFVIRFRWLVLLVTIGGAMAIATNASKLEFESNYRVFFSPENPELQAFENFQTTYVKNDNLLFVIEPADGKVFTNETLAVVHELTEEGWQIPYSSRVDSITNFQHTYAMEDDLIVEDLINNPGRMSQAELQRREEIALAEPLLRDQLLTRNGSVTAVNVTLQFPEKELDEVPVTVAYARDLRDRIEAQYPEIDIHLSGVSMLNNAFSEAGLSDAATLVPLMFLVVLIMTALTIRSVTATLSVLVVIILSITTAMGMAGLLGIKLTPPSISAMVIILTLAVADSIHILMTMRTSMRAGMAKYDALVEAVRVNFLAVAITSLTTAIGFAALNFSDSPPFRDLGNISAMGIVSAWFLSVTVLIALISLVPFKPSPKPADSGRSFMVRLADVVIAHSKKWLILMGLAAAALISFIPTLQLDDQWREYFDQRIEFRREADLAVEHFGFYAVEFSIPAAEPGGIAEPTYLNRLEAFTDYLRQQEYVTHVYSVTDILKRLNKNLNRDDPSFYRIPQDRELAAQYLLLYELSLPYGLDLNDRINIDKSATRLTVTLSGYTSTAATKEFLGLAESWLAENAPDMQAPPTSPQVMFTYIADRNMESMVSGTIVAIIAISIIMMLALRSFSMGMLSLIPNGLPILVAFGTWALVVGFVGFSVAAVAAVSLGIVVDDTVHFLTKYVRARREKDLSIEDSIRFAFDTVGFALVVNTIILSCGFAVLMFSSFKINAEMGLLTTLSILFALILDCFFLPPLLMLFGRDRKTTKISS